jgi:hypothetical protein
VDEDAKEMIRRLKKYYTVHRIRRALTEDVLPERYEKYASTYRSDNFGTRPDRPWGPPSFLHNAYRVFPAVKRPKRGVDHPPHLAPKLKEE